MITPFHFELNGNSYSVDLNRPLDISIPLRNGAGNPNCYHTAPPVITPVISKGFIGSVAHGGVCNHKMITMAPHGNGTHTECYGHLSSNEQATLNQCLMRFHFIAQLVTIEPVTLESGDKIIKWSQITSQLPAHNIEALIIRTLPNPGQKMWRQYSDTNPPYLEKELAEGLRKKGINHLLVDLPSIDKENDQGALAAHKAFWNYPGHPRKGSTITELVFVPDSIPDALYLMNLQITSLESDASPSKPVLFNLYGKTHKKG